MIHGYKAGNFQTTFQTKNHMKLGGEISAFPCRHVFSAHAQPLSLVKSLHACRGCVTPVVCVNESSLPVPDAYFQTGMKTRADETFSRLAPFCDLSNGLLN